MLIQASFFTKRHISKLLCSDIETYLRMIGMSQKRRITDKSIATIAKSSKYSSWAVTDSLKKLERLGYLKVNHASCGSCRYNTYRIRNYTPRIEISINDAILYATLIKLSHDGIVDERPFTYLRGISRYTIRNSIKRLEESGYITVIRDKRHSGHRYNQYVIKGGK